MERRITDAPVPDSRDQAISRAYQDLASGYQTYAHVRAEMQKHASALLRADEKINGANHVLTQYGLPGAPKPERPKP